MLRGIIYAFRGAVIETPREKNSADLAAPASLDAARAARLRLALSAPGAELLGILQDPDPDVIGCALKNPHLGEAHLLALLKRPGLPERLIRIIFRLPPVACGRRLKIALAGHPQTPAPLLATLLGQLYLFELVTLMQLPGASAEHRLAAQQALLKRLPETELGNKITLAHRASAAVLEVLLAEGEPRLVEAVLANSRLKESGLLAFLRSPAATAETISAVARHPLWGARINLRLAMLRNRKTPPVWFILFLPSLATRDVKALLDWKGLQPRQLEAVQEELERRVLLRREREIKAARPT